MLDAATVTTLRHHWDHGWNSEDVDVIMAPFAEDVVFSSPYIGRVSGDEAKNTIEGRDALRAYVEHALARTPGIRYTVHGAYAGTDAAVLVYSCITPAGVERHGADSMRIDESGQVIEWRCHYTEMV